MNNNDMYSSMMIASIKKNFNDQNKKLESELKLNDNDILDKKNLNDLNNRKSSLKKLEQYQIDEFLETNNESVFTTIKLIIRNLILALVWSIAFYKLSRF